MMVPEFEAVAFYARAGQDFRSGAEPVRLAHHQGRGKAHELAAADRAGAAAARPAGDVQGVRRDRSRR